MNPNALSYWFPKIEAAGLPVPKTMIVQMPTLVWEGILNTINGEPAPSGSNPLAFFDEIAAAADKLGWPAFLRTDHTSHKHNWKNTCFLANRDDVPDHVFEIAELSELAGFAVDLSWNRWAVREMLPVRHLGVCRGYGDMPVVREFRFFVADGKIQCFHNYWPDAALAEGDVEWFALPEEHKTYSRADEVLMRDMVTAAAEAVGGDWSIDVLDTRRGWMITDMALAEDSFHMEGCPHAHSRGLIHG